jgi:RNA polymerase sigma-70 factor (ECF subfamily)
MSPCLSKLKEEATKQQVSLYRKEDPMRLSPASERTDDSLLAASASRGDIEAFNQLVLNHQDMVYHHAMALLSSPDFTEDAAQESFIRAFHNIRTFREGSFRGWLLKITTNICYDEMRRLKRRPAVPLFPEDEYGDEMESPSWLADRNPSPEEQVEREQLTSHVYAVLDALPASFRSVLTLVDLYQLDYADAAGILGVPLGTVKSRLARARLAMREKIQATAAHKTGVLAPGTGTSISWNGIQ